MSHFKSGKYTAIRHRHGGGIRCRKLHAIVIGDVSTEGFGDVNIDCSGSTAAAELIPDAAVDSVQRTGGGLVMVAT